MLIHFKIHYNTSPGQKLCISGSVNKLGSWDKRKALEMNYLDNGHWYINIDFKAQTEILEYKYFLIDQHDNQIWEDGANRIISSVAFNKEHLFLLDKWRAFKNEEKVMSASAFKDVLMKPNTKVLGTKIATAKKRIQFNISLPRIGKDNQVCVLGNTPKLGDWDKTEPLLLAFNKQTNNWTGNITLTGVKIPLEYKYGIYNSASDAFETLEEGDNRVLSEIENQADTCVYMLNDESFRYPLGNWKAAGVSLPVFSLRSDSSFGVGDFNDLIGFIDWAKTVNLKMVQLLPVNETITDHGWLDSYPYKSISVIALHPIYLNLEKLGTLKSKTVLQEYALHKERLNKEDKVLFPEVLALKSKYYKLIFDQEKKTFFKQKDFIQFFKNNKDWLEPYAAFVFLRDKMKSADFRIWSKHSTYNKTEIENLCRPESEDWDDISVHYFIQFHLDKQLKEVSNYAHDNGIILKGDIPIGISPNSVEAWTEPHLFNLDSQAGAPPDDFAVKGQNWGFPTYKWDNIAKEDYAWWINRLQKMAEYFDAYRIDHILGFFRIWEIPLHAVEGLLGYFNPSLPLTSQEIEQYGIPFNYERMVKPYIRHHHIVRIFGEYMPRVIDEFLDKSDDDQYRLKPDFNTQQKVNQYFLEGIDEEDLDEINKTIRDGLFELIANVLFIQTGENQWHPRISLHSTLSYLELDNAVKHSLDKLYIHYFYKRHNDFWHQKGIEKLKPIISAGNMLVCGEDLGMVPDCVPPVMDELNILSLEIQRMSKDPKKKYAHPDASPYLSVCTTSTHDMSTIRGWWEENKEDIQEFYHHILGNYGQAPYFAEPWICEQIITQHLYSPAMWTTFPLQDLLAMDGDLRWSKTQQEQINEPSNVRHKWRFRLHQSIKQLQNATAFNGLLRSLIEKSGRNSDY